MSRQKELSFTSGPPTPGTTEHDVYKALDREWRTSWEVQARMASTYTSEPTVTTLLRELRAAGYAESSPLPGTRSVRWRRC